MNLVKRFAKIEQNLNGVSFVTEQSLHSRPPCRVKGSTARGDVNRLTGLRGNHGS
jgi:hypothetical protein